MDTPRAESAKPGRKALLVATIVHRSRHTEPFAHRDENASYQHFAALCADRGLDLHVTHFDNPSASTSTFAWAWRGAWELVDLPLDEVTLCYADLPPNLDRAVAFRAALEARPIQIVNTPQLGDLLTDKLATFSHFADHVPATWNANAPDLADRLRTAQLHADLSTEKLVLKPRFGERGRGIVTTDLDGLAAYSASELDDYIVQAFLETRSGIPGLGIRKRHDVRLILRDGAILLAFARLPAPGSFVSNTSQGGHELPLVVEALPSHVTRFAGEVDDRLRHFGTRFYSLDIGIGRSGKIWIFELNTMPGIVWSKDLPKNQPLHRAMQTHLAAWLAAAVLATGKLHRRVSCGP